MLSECLAVIQNLWRENYFEWAFVNGPKSDVNAVTSEVGGVKAHPLRSARTHAQW